MSDSENNTKNEARLFVSPIAEPLASDKMNKKLVKLILLVGCDERSKSISVSISLSKLILVSAVPYGTNNTLRSTRVHCADTKV